MGDPTATQVMFTLPPGIISLLSGRMEKRGGTRRTARRHEEGERMTKEGKESKRREKGEVTREADENGSFSGFHVTQKVQHGKCELKQKIK